MMNLKNYAENRGKTIINIFALRNKKKEQGRYCICNESKNTYIESTPQTKPF